MKSLPVILVLFLSFLTFSCTDEINNVGMGIQPASDEIKVGTDTFHVNTSTIFVDHMYSYPDSFLLGTYYSERYGTTRADILAQVKYPENYAYPPDSQPDSALVVMYYTSWFGDSYSPIDVNIYEMNKATFNYLGNYTSDIDVDTYTDRSIKMGSRIFTAKDASGTRSSTSNFIVFKLTPEFKNRFFTTDPEIYSSDEKFNNFFKGMYITANFGASTMLNVRKIDLELHYHYTYLKNGKDTVVRNYVTFPANEEVRQVNRFMYSDRVQKMAERDNVNFNYVVSPANLQTRVEVPLSKMKQRMTNQTTNKNLMMNSAILRVEADEIEKNTLAHPAVQYMLLIKESAIDRFFSKKELPSDTCAVLAKYSASINTSTSAYDYYYSFNLAAMVANELKIAKQQNVEPAENLNLRLVPVRATVDANGSITSVSQQFVMSASTIRSGKNSTSPMRIKAVFSGF